MLRLRTYKKEDADTIISWSKDEKAFYQWSAGVMGECHFTHNGKKYVLIIPVFDKESPIYKLCLELLAQEPGGTAGPIKLSQIFAPVGFDLKEE